jgi:hypothetical protein
MKKLMSVLIGLSLFLAVAAPSFSKDDTTTTTKKKNKKKKTTEAPK